MHFEFYLRSHLLAVWCDFNEIQFEDMISLDISYLEVWYITQIENETTYEVDHVSIQNKHENT